MSYLETNGTFTFNGVTSSTYNVWITGGGTYNAPVRRNKEFSIPGRNGSLSMDENAFEQIDHIYPAFIASSFNTNIQGLRNALLSGKGYKRLTDTYHTDEFYLARYVGGLEIEVAPGARGGMFDIVFERDPRRFLTSGETEQTFTANGSISNPTLFNAKPLIRVTGYGTLTIGSFSATIANTFAYVDIDSETQDCYHGTDNANAQVTLLNQKFPEIAPGTNNITISGNITSVKITPRWYRV